MGVCMGKGVVRRFVMVVSAADWNAQRKICRSHTASVSVVRAECVAAGLDGAGKTTLLYRMKINKVVPTIPTIGFNAEQSKCSHRASNVLAKAIRPSYSVYYGTTAVQYA
eukprot:18627-Heterococcus_DN1.PRE.1